MIFKIDFEIAYDCVDWDFLDKVMEKKGFGYKWRMWVWGPLKVGSKEVVLSYLQFVDDTMFFCFGQRTPPLSLITFWGSLRRCQGLKLIGTSVRIWVYVIKRS